MSQPDFIRSGTILTLTVAGFLLASCNDSQETATNRPVSPPPLATPPSQTKPQVQANNWEELEQLVGQRPSQSGLFDNSPISKTLNDLLGSRFDQFKINMQVETPLEKDRDVLFTSGNRQHQGVADSAYLLIRPESRTLEVGLWENGKLTTFKSQGQTIRKPQDIQAMITDAAFRL